MAKEQIYKSENIVVTVISGFNSKIAVVTFANYVPNPTLKGDGFGENFLSKLSIDACHVSSAGNDWFQYQEMHEVVRVINHFLKQYEEVVTYGSSMGGYGALRFSSILDATRVVAISPQVSIDKKRVPFENRWHQADTINFIDDAVVESLLARTHIFVLYDPFDLDRRHVDLIECGNSMLTRIPVPFSSHTAATFYHEIGLLKAIISDLIIGKYNAPRWAEIRRRNRHKSATYWRELTRYLIRRRSFAAAADCAEKAIRLAPNDVKTMALQQTCLRQCGRWEEAVAVLEKMIQLDPKAERFIRVLSEARKMAVQIVVQPPRIDPPLM